MELTKKQVLHIESLLEKNGVKFWDIKIELLDHVVTDVEKRVELGEKFEDAIQNSFISLGWEGNFDEQIFNDPDAGLDYEAEEIPHST